ncbi:OmpL47-type beta-barrel domain-containing protein [Paenibacillus methanolicus]|uniref:Uncharacterized protein n=1 Tax=Paenibacillus methanolicus TaxID=582686 RepID=A0A5S5BP27_9BACL|nr:hypothetical protein [Paenibacillus methanolicus]TYP68889.1 hypothetical protein BCM02_1177 [Paenibacillus methanolicus]
MYKLLFCKFGKSVILSVLLLVLLVASVTPVFAEDLPTPDSLAEQAPPSIKATETVPQITAQIDTPSGLVVKKPLEGSVFKDQIELDITAYTSEGKPSKIDVVLYYGHADRESYYLATGVGEIRKTATIPSIINGNKVKMEILASGISPGYTLRTIFLDRSSSYAIIESVEGKILDFNEDKILYTGYNYGYFGGADTVLKILDRHTRQETILSTHLPEDFDYDQVPAYLTPKGALFIQQLENHHQGLMEYSDGELTLHDQSDYYYGRNYRVIGSNAAFERQGSVLLKNVQNGVERIVADKGILWDLTEDGTVLYTNTTDRKLYTYKDGKSTRVSTLTDPSVWESSAKTDGTRTLYMRSDTNSLMMHNGTESIELAQNVFLPYETGFHIENGWSAYTKVEPLGTGIWMVSPQGEKKQVTFCNSHAMIRSVGSNGEVLSTCNGNLYYSSFLAGSDAFPVIADLGKLIYKNNKLYSRTGGSILAIHVTPNDITPPKTQLLVNGAAPVASGWYKPGARVEFLAQDDPAGTGVRDTRYDINNGPRQTYSGPFLLSGEDTYFYQVDFNSTDNNGNQEGQQRIIIKIDSDIPYTKSALSPNWSADKTYIKSYTVTLKSYDQTTGVKATYYRINGGEWKTYSGPFEMNQVGERRLDFYSVDNVGNEEKHPA